MTEQAAAFVRNDIVEPRRAPVRMTGLIGFARTRLFNSPLNIAITLIGTVLLWLVLAPVVKFMLIDAVWTGSDRAACLEENVGHAVGACCCCCRC
jgi:general L-amino acid transport system permease protein